MLLELAIGDAYGAGFEYSPDAFVNKNNDGEHYHQHPKHKIGPGCYTDDTQMTLAIAELLADKEEFTPESLADKFVEVFHRDRRLGYAGQFYRFLCEIGTGQEFQERIKPYSDKSGAAMRTTPLGLLGNVKDVVKLTTMQAKLTHDTADGVAAAVGAALLTHYAYHNLGPSDDQEGIFKFINSHAWDKLRPYRGKIGSKGIESVSAAITAYCANRSLKPLLMDCISLTGDVDTVATIALAAASCSIQYEKDLSPKLFANLENGKYGKDYLTDLDKRMFKAISS